MKDEREKKKLGLGTEKKKKSEKDQWNIFHFFVVL